MTAAIDQDFENFLTEFPKGMRNMLSEMYERDKQSAQRGGAFGRLKDVKEFWLLMGLMLPKPVYKTDHPWLYTVDWHFDAFEQGFQRFGSRVPKEIHSYIADASKKARELYNARELDAARDLMAEVWNMSWTRKSRSKGVGG